MKLSLKTLGLLIKTSFKEWQEDKASRLAAAMAYYTIFSLAPLLIITLAIAGSFFDRATVRDQLLAQFSSLIGAPGALFIQSMLESVSQPADGLIASLIGIVTLMFGASGVFNAMQDALNTIWEVAPKPRRGLTSILRERVLSFSIVLVIGFLLLVLLVISALLSFLTNYLNGSAEAASLLMQGLNFIVSFGAITLMFAMIFKIVPDVQIAWRNVWIGAVVTALLFSIGKSAIGFYLGNSAITSAYGAAASLVVILIWVYYSAQIFFLGAEFTQVYTNMFGKHPEPAPNAIPLTEKARAQQGIPRTEELEQRRQARLSQLPRHPGSLHELINMHGSFRPSPARPFSSGLVGKLSVGLDSLFNNLPYYIGAGLMMMLLGLFYFSYRHH